MRSVPVRDEEHVGRRSRPAKPLHATRYTLHTSHLTPYTLHPTPYTLHPTPYTLHPTPYTLHPTPYTLHLSPSLPRSLSPSLVYRSGPRSMSAVAAALPSPTSCTLHPAPCTLYPTPCTLHPTPYTLHLSPSLPLSLSPSLPLSLARPLFLSGVPVRAQKQFGSRSRLAPWTLPPRRCPCVGAPPGESAGERDLKFRVSRE